MAKNTTQEERLDYLVEAFNICFIRIILNRR